jgi:hypothetical protein
MIRSEIGPLLQENFKINLILGICKPNATLGKGAEDLGKTLAEMPDALKRRIYITHPLYKLKLQTLTVSSTLFKSKSAYRCQQIGIPKI